MKKNSYPDFKHTHCNWDIEGILLVSLLLISCAYAVLEAVTLPSIPFCQPKTATILITIIAVAVTSILIRKYSELRQRHEEKAQRLRAKIEELNEKLGNINEIDEDDDIPADLMDVKKKEWGKIFDSIHDWVCLIDLNSVILRTNRAGEKYTGLSVKDIIGRICCQLVHGTDPPLNECPLPKMLKTGQRESVELQIKNGRWMLITIDPIFDGKGKMIKAVHIARDITNRKQAEMEKAKLEVLSRRLQKADSLGRMAGAIAHHFNNQLMTIMGNLDLAISDVPKGKKLSKTLTAAMQAANRAANLSRLMLTYLGQTSDKQEPLDLSELCRQSLPLLRAAIPNQLTIETHFPFPGSRINANANQIQQALTNMINNACESCNGSGAISISIKTVSAESIPTLNRFPVDWLPLESTYASLEVRDTGCGIVEKDIERIFDPFFSSKFPGRGLGLPVVLGIARAHRGAVAVESDPGIGSLFRIFLPVLPEETLCRPIVSAGPREAQTFNASKTLGMEGGGTVLLVEDEAPVRKVAHAMLLLIGFRVLEAKDGVEAEKVFEEHLDEIRFVLCDLTMPRMDGWETLTALRKLAPCIPVILASGYDERQVMSGDHPEQPHAFLQKPFSLNDLATKVRQVLTLGEDPGGKYIDSRNPGLTGGPRRSERRSPC